MNDDQRPVLLSKEQAMEFAADKLVGMAHDYELLSLLVAALDKPEASPELRQKLRECPEPKLQAAALRAAAKTIREIALEERLVQARVGAAAFRAGGG